MIGNTVVQLAERPDGTVVPHNGHGVMFIDVDDDDETLNSSAATLMFSNENGAVSSCTNIIYAGLYWTGRAASGTNFVNAELPDGTVVENRFQKNQIKFKKEGNAYEVFTPAGGEVFFRDGDPNDTETGRGMYVGFVDITNYVQSHGEGVYYAADIATSTAADQGGAGAGYYGGWGMVVVYENPLMKTRYVSVYDGYAFVKGENSSEFGYDFTIDNFQSIQEGPVDFKLGIMAGEGDRVDQGDHFRMKNVNTNSYEDLSHVNNVTSNFFNSSIVTEGERFPALDDNAGLDIVSFSVDNADNKFIGNRQQEAQFEYGTTSDNYVIFNLALAVDAYQPEIQPINEMVTPVPTSGMFAPGSEVDFKLVIKNVGTEATEDGKVEIPFPDFGELAVIDVSKGEVEIVDNKLVWDIGDLELPATPDGEVAVMNYRLSLYSCEELLSSGNCSPTVSLNGSFSGRGALSEYAINTDFISGFGDADSDCVPEGNPIYEDITFGLDISGCFDFSGAENLEVCAGEDVLIEFAGLTGGIASYEWSVDNTAIGIEATGEGTISFVTVNTTAIVQIATVTVVPKTSFGCEGAPKSFTVTVNPTPSAPAVVDVTTYVGATGVVYDVTALAGHTLVWFDENGDRLTPNEMPVVNTTVAGESTVYVAQQHDETGCISEVVPVSVFVKPVGLSVEKIADLTEIDATGELTYTITIENTGEFDLTGVSVTDVLTQHGVAGETLDVGSVTESDNTDDILAVGERWTYTFAYLVDQTRIDNGADLENTVSVITEEGATGEDIATTTITRSPDIEVIKVADKATVSEAGEVITYTITVTNTGNVTLENYTVTDVLFPEWNGSIDRLAPDATRSFELEYEVTQADIDNGGVLNVASASGESPNDPEDEDEVEVPSEKQPGIEVSKTADKATVSEAGEVITYTITVTNTGNVTLENYTVTDVLFPEWSGSIDRLAPDATRSFELEYEVTQADIDNGGVVNVASAGGENPDDPEDEDEVEVPSEKQPGIEVSKTADKATVNEAGEVITYTITVTNTGNVTLENYTVTDVLFPGWNGSIDRLAPDATRSFELEYEVTQADIDNGGVVNVASAGGENPDDPEDEDEVEVPSEK
ncbi:MAG TPA: PKD-like domain-containing protein, partial [Parapedobacter sp.]|nr:PKD-like domain-containing protein [Parapedobacter sp.]